MPSAVMPSSPTRTGARRWEAGRSAAASPADERAPARAAGSSSAPDEREARDTASATRTSITMGCSQPRQAFRTLDVLTAPPFYLALGASGNDRAAVGPSPGVLRS